MTRYPELDFARGTGILLMLLYHLIFDLYFLGAGNLLSNPLVLATGRGAAVLLILVSGISLSISTRRWKGRPGAGGYYAKRIMRLAFVAALITLVTWIYPHEGFIFFGIIHFITLATLLGFWMADSRKALSIIALLSLPIWLVLQTQGTSDPLLSVLGWRTTLYTLDLFSLFPWMGVFALGMLAGDRYYAPAGRKFELMPLPGQAELEWMGKNSLAIYLAHQPVLFGILYLLTHLRPG